MRNEETLNVRGREIPFSDIWVFTTFDRAMWPYGNFAKRITNVNSLEEATIMGDLMGKTVLELEDLDRMWIEEGKCLGN